MTDMTNILIVGAGQAGAQAAISLRQEGFEGRITIVGEEADLPYERPPLSKDYLAGERTADRLLLVSDGHVTPFEGDLDDYRKFLLTGDNAPTRRAESNHQPEAKASKEEARRSAAETP